MTYLIFYIAGGVLLLLSIIIGIFKKPLLMSSYAKESFSYDQSLRNEMCKYISMPMLLLSILLLVSTLLIKFLMNLGIILVIVFVIILICITLVKLLSVDDKITDKLNR